MAEKRVRKVMAVMMIKLSILAAFEVKAIHPTPSEPDSISPLSICLKTELEKCKAEYEHESIEWPWCIILHFSGCVYQHEFHRNPTDVVVHSRAIRCIEECFPKSKFILNVIRAAKCLLECYEKKIEKN